MEGNPSLGKFWPLVGRFSDGWRIKPETLACLVFAAMIRLPTLSNESQDKDQGKDKGKDKDKNKRGVL